MSENKIKIIQELFEVDEIEAKKIIEYIDLLSNDAETSVDSYFKYLDSFKDRKSDFVLA